MVAARGALGVSRFTIAASVAFRRLPPCEPPRNSLNFRVLDIKLIREKTEFVRSRLATRGAGDESKIDELLKLDEQRRKSLAEVETLKSLRNRVSKEIGALVGQKKLAEAEAKKAETKDLGEKIAALDKQAAEAEAARDALMLQLPNLPHESIPLGKTAEDNPVIRVVGEKTEYAFKPKTHVELCESLKLVDFARAAKLSDAYVTEPVKKKKKKKKFTGCVPHKLKWCCSLVWLANFEI